MDTRISSKGEIALPLSIRRKLGLRAGDELSADIKNGDIVLTPRRRRKHKTRITTDPVTGLPVLTAEEGAPKLTSEEVYEMLADFP